MEMYVLTYTTIWTSGHLDAWVILHNKIYGLAYLIISMVHRRSFFKMSIDRSEDNIYFCNPSKALSPPCMSSPAVRYINSSLLFITISHLTVPEVSLIKHGRNHHIGNDEDNISRFALLVLCSESFSCSTAE